MRHGNGAGERKSSTRRIDRCILSLRTESEVRGLILYDFYSVVNLSSQFDCTLAWPVEAGHRALLNGIERWRVDLFNLV